MYLVRYHCAVGWHIRRSDWRKPLADNDYPYGESNPGFRTENPTVVNSACFWCLGKPMMASACSREAVVGRLLMAVPTRERWHGHCFGNDLLDGAGKMQGTWLADACPAESNECNNRGLDAVRDTRTDTLGPTYSSHVSSDCGLPRQVSRYHCFCAVDSGCPLASPITGRRRFPRPRRNRDATM
jgi:hypothetical protein